MSRGADLCAYSLPGTIKPEPSRKSESGGADLNRRPSPWQGDILPLNYRREYLCEQSREVAAKDRSH